MRRRPVPQVVIAAGAVLGLVTVHAPAHAGSVWAGGEPYLTHASVGAALGLVAAGLVRLALPQRRAHRSGVGRRQAIPESVRHEVWRRDRGTCVECGARGRLEFDHIIPVSRGGSNTVRNIELRCEPCNRRKGARV
jgi:hypothetical protein